MMTHASATQRSRPFHELVNHAFGRLYSFVLAAAAALVLIAAATIESFNPVRLGAALTVLILAHLLRTGRLLFSRESVLYTIYMAYMFLSLLWTPDRFLALNTLLPALDFILVLILFGSLATYHDFRTVLAGTLAGFLVGAVLYTLMVGFPFVYPKGFSYNAIAGMYLFGLFINLMLGLATRSRLQPLAIGLVLLALIAATTSIKTNLGILLGALAAAALHRRDFLKVLRQGAVPFVLVALVIAYAAASNEAVVERVQAGLERVALGVEILSSRDDTPSGTSYNQREYWMQEGLRGWSENPLFGDGVEAFRADYGITSHSTPIDLLYNTGIIGLALYYAIFASVAYRALSMRAEELSGLRALLFATCVCYAFITISGTMLYNSFLAVFIAISTAACRRYAPSCASNLTEAGPNP